MLEKHLLYIIGQSPFGGGMHPSPPPPPPFTSEGKDDLKSRDVLMQVTYVPSLDYPKRPVDISPIIIQELWPLC